MWILCELYYSTRIQHSFDTEHKTISLFYEPEKMGVTFPILHSWVVRSCNHATQECAQLFTAVSRVGACTELIHRFPAHEEEISEWYRTTDWNNSLYGVRLIA